MTAQPPPRGLLALLREDMRHYLEDVAPGGRSLAMLRFAGFQVCAVYRFGVFAHDSRVPVWGSLLRLCAALLRGWSRLVHAAEISHHARIGRFFIVHTVRGVIIAPGAVLGDHVVVNNGVIIGGDRLGDGCSSPPGVPVIGDHVKIGVGARLLGGIHVGSRVLIGANAVVTGDVPDQHVAVGIPAVTRPLTDLGAVPGFYHTARRPADTPRAATSEARPQA